MSKISIKMFPARCGDCFLVKLDNGKNIVIDMGYKETYTNYLKDEFIKLKQEGKCIDLLVVTHIDEDHIEGVIEFIKENGDIKNPNIIEVKEIWHNSYKHLQFKNEKVQNIPYDEKEILELYINNDKCESQESNNENEPISAIQGSTLACYLYKYGYEKIWNKSFDSNAINLDYKNIIDFEDLKFKILSPNTIKLEKIATLWDRELKRNKRGFKLSCEKIFDSAYEVYIKNFNDIYSFNDIDSNENQKVSYESPKMKTLYELIQNKEILQNKIDSSKSNGSSIAFILEYKNKKILFLGDSHEDIIIEQINNHKIYKFDAIKVSHHGSIKNNYNWINLIKSNFYLISTNGEKHNHPDKEFIAKLIKSNNDKKELYFNYNIDICSEIENLNIKNCIVKIGDEFTPIEINI